MVSDEVISNLESKKINEIQAMKIENLTLKNDLARDRFAIAQENYMKADKALVEYVNRILTKEKKTVQDIEKIDIENLTIFFKASSEA